MADLVGGKLIGEGSSTCVFKPNLPCKNKKIDISDKRVAKLFLKKPDDLKRELETNKKITKLPKSKEWSVVLDDISNNRINGDVILVSGDSGWKNKF